MEVFAVFEQWSQRSTWGVRSRRQRPGRLAAALAVLGALALPFGGMAQAQSEDGLLVPSVPLMVVDAEAVTEGSSGEKAMVFPVAMSQPPLTPVRVVVSTRDRTATAGSDYDATTVELLFGVGSPLIQQVKVPINGDTTVEPDETLGLEIVRLSGPATAVDKLAAGRIVNDDVLQPPVTPALSVDDLQVDEPLSGTATAKVKVQLTGIPNAAEPVSVQFLDVEGTATEPEDYQLTDGTLQFTSADATPGSNKITKEISVTIKNDALDSSIVEQFKVKLQNVVNATISKAEAKVDIVDADFDECELNPQQPGCVFPLPENRQVASAGGG